MTRRIFLDYNSTTPCDPRVVEAMRPYFSERFGNAASSTHPFGWEANEAVERARAQVARLIGARPNEIVWTSGATESNNLAVLGVARANRGKGERVVTTAIEHKALLDPCMHLARAEGFEVTILPVGRDGLVDPETVQEAIQDDTLLVSVMTANNETGVLQPIAEIGRICREHGVPFHTDAAQAVGRIPVDVGALGVDLLSFSGHKLYGPKGIGGLYIHRAAHLRIEPLIFGGGHERGLRSGTLNVPAIVGIGQACELCDDLQTEMERQRSLRDRLREAIRARVPDAIENGHPVQRLPNTLNLSFPDVPGEELITNLRHVAVSSGSACTSASPEPSHVLAAMGVSPTLAHSSIRFSLGRPTTADEIDEAAEAVADVALRLRQLNHK